MSINEEITALLNGDLQDETRVAELMHVLAVSPERRGMLLQQIRMSRAFSAMTGSITPPPAADAGILAGLSAIDSEFGGPPPSPAGAAPAGIPPVVFPAAAAGFSALWLRNILFGIMLVALGVGTGYLLWHDTTQGTITTEQKPDARASETMIVAGMGDSLAAARAQLASLAREHREALAQIAELRSREQAGTRNGTTAAPRRQRIISPASTPAAVNEPLLRGQSSLPAEPEKPSAPEITPVAPQTLAMSRPQAPAAAPRPDRNAQAVSSGASLLSQYGAEDGGVGPWQAGMRDHFRLSLPRVYGLNGSRSILFDRDLFVSYRFSGEDSPFSSMELGASIGETQFSQVYHSGQPGRAVDLQIEQSPTVRYGRVLLGSDLFRTHALSGGLEFGAGAALTGSDLLGPLGTFGLNLEYRPVDMLALQGGLSSWFLWTEQSGQIYTSTNLNAHLGFAIGF